MAQGARRGGSGAEPGIAEVVVASRSLPAVAAEITLILVPEHLALVFVIGVISLWVSGVYGLEAQVGAVAVLIAAVVGTLVVIPTGGEIPIIIALLAVGGGAGVTGALLIVLPALSTPSMVVAGKSLGWGTTTAMGSAVALGGVLSGVVLMLLS